MKPERKQSLVVLGIQLCVWLFLLLAPAGISFLVNPSGHTSWMFLMNSAFVTMPMAMVYLTSYYLLLPYLFYRGRKVWFALATTALILLANSRSLMVDVSSLDDMARTGFYTLIASSVTLDLLMAVAAFAIRGYLRSLHLQRQLEEEHRKSAEAELTWLKNQLNPHFLFNSLNNISSLTQIDPDQAQDAIAQLSDLLRYALYESNKPSVPLMGEVEFMQNYISMMKLRCSTLTTVTTRMPASCPSHLSIAPLLFISFIENAFKHGTSGSQPSSVDVSLTLGEENRLVFECRNTNFPKPDTDRSGSGVGLENTRRRLDLLYPDRYEWQQSLTDGIYQVRVTLSL